MRAGAQAELEEPGGKLHTAIADAVAVMLQREVPEHVNVATARLAHSLGKPVFMDVGRSDAPRAAAAPLAQRGRHTVSERARGIVGSTRR